MGRSTIGANIRQIRNEKGLTQKQVAEKANIPHTTYSNYENGNRNPNESQIEKISQALGVSSEYLHTVENFKNAETKWRERTVETINEYSETLIFKTRTAIIKLEKENNLDHKKLKIEKRKIIKEFRNYADEFKNDLNSVLIDMQKHLEIGDLKSTVKNGQLGKYNKLTNIIEKTDDFDDLTIYNTICNFVFTGWATTIETDIEDLVYDMFFECMKENIDIKKTLLEKISQMDNVNNEYELKKILFEVF